jgi:hypothetical protein
VEDDENGCRLIDSVNAMELFIASRGHQIWNPPKAGESAIDANAPLFRVDDRV